MNDILQRAAADIAVFLKQHLPTLDEDWWHKNVENRLSFQQQRLVQERGITALEQLDFAALLRVLDQNWYELSQAISLPREGRTWVKELQTVRNKWAHQSAENSPASETYRDADTLERFLGMLSATPDSIAAVQKFKMDALGEMTTPRSVPATPIEATSGPEQDDSRPKSESMYIVGDLVALRSEPATLMPVIEMIDGGPERRYVVFHDGKKVTYYESQLRRPTQPTQTHSNLTASELLAYLTSLQLLTPSTASLYSLRSGRVQFVPYQYRPVLKLIRADRPRLLIADEVGVGKTIEAGLIIKELQARTEISSVLIICPKALVAERKWFLEMKRFDEQFTALDGKMLRHCLRETHLDGEWPHQYAKAIVPFSLFDSQLIFGGSEKRRRKEEGLLSLEPPPKFDLVIVDEAHHIRNAETYLHQGVRYFCDNAQAAIFLTATPVQLGSKDLFTLLNVLRPDLVIDHASFEQMAEPNPSINMAVQHSRSADEGWQSRARACLDEVAQTQWGGLFLRESPEFQRIYDQLGEEQACDADRISITRSLEELYTFSPMINRTRRRDIGEFTTRKPETLTVEFTDEQQQLHDDLLDIITRIFVHAHGQQNVKFMMTTIRRQAASCLYGLAPLLRNILTGKLESLEDDETEYEEIEPTTDFFADVHRDIDALLERADNLDPHDPKVEAFVRVLKEKGEMDNNKSMVFSTFRHTLRYISERTKRAGLRYGLVHGGVPDEERAELRRRFALPKDDANALDVLLSSEVGCEGLDFQFCDLLVNYDLPWNPMRVEQRIGRIDRYGQKSEAVAIVNLITPGTVDADIYERCLWRIGVFHHAVGGSEEILGEITDELRSIAESFSLSGEERAERLQQLGDNGIRQIQEEQALEEKQVELFGLTVPKQSWREDIEAAETFWLSGGALRRCVSTYLSRVTGSDAEVFLGEKKLQTLRLNQEARTKILEYFKRQPRSAGEVARRWEKWLKGSEPMLPVTFDQETATADPNVVHLNALHPLVRQAARYLERSQPVRVNLTASSNEQTPGQYPFAIYKWQKVGVRTDDTLVAVTTDPGLDDGLMSLLPSATDALTECEIAPGCFDELDQRHYHKWSTARADHMAANRELVQHRRQSLKVSHEARCRLLEDQVQQTTSDKILRMKESELARAKSDYERRLAELDIAADSADVRAEPIVLGSITLTRSDQR